MQGLTKLKKFRIWQKKVLYNNFHNKKSHFSDGIFYLTYPINRLLKFQIQTQDIGV